MADMGEIETEIPAKEVRHCSLPWFGESGHGQRNDGRLVRVSVWDGSRAIRSIYLVADDAKNALMLVCNLWSNACCFAVLSGLIFYWRFHPLCTIMLSIGYKEGRMAWTNMLYGSKKDLLCLSWANVRYSNSFFILLRHPFNGLFSRTTSVSRYQKDKTSLNLNEARDNGFSVCSGISWTICKQCAPRFRQITTPLPPHIKQNETVVVVYCIQRYYNVIISSYSNDSDRPHICRCADQPSCICQLTPLCTPSSTWFRVFGPTQGLR